MALIDRIKYDGAGAECEVCKIDAKEGETRCSKCGKPFVQRPWLVYKFPSENLVLGAQLIVNQSQEVVFFKEGNALDVFGPGRHTLSTANLPLLQKLVNLPFGGETPFTAEVYFINKVSKLDMKWGTPDPFQVTEPRYQIIVRVRGFGRFGIKISDSRNFVIQIIGALHSDQLSDYQTVISYFKGLVITKFKDTIADMIVNKKTSVLDITASIDSISTTCREKVTSEFDRFGIEVLNFFIESINVPEEDISKLRKMLEERAEFEILGDERYTRKRSFDVLEKAASSEGAGGMMGAGMGLGMGIGAGASAGGVLGDVAKQMKVTPPEKQQIKCLKCGTLNSSTAKFCSNCGEKLETYPVICPNCKVENSPGSKFCANCGTSLQKIKCPKCNFENVPGSKFCANCGNKIGE
ncbi:MAG: SPFH domain-containing protein [Candidatus Anstonellales archaeon]